MKLNILWVEDEFSTVIKFLDQLHQGGHAVTLAENRSNASDLLRRGYSYELIVLDSSMPENSEDAHFLHSGCTFFNDLRAGEFGDWGKTVNVIFLTNFKEAVGELLDKGVVQPAKILSKVSTTREVIKGFNEVVPNIIVHGDVYGHVFEFAQNDTFSKSDSKVLADKECKEELKRLITAWMSEADDHFMTASEKIISIVASSNEEHKHIENVKEFRGWVSDLGDDVKNALVTSANIATISSFVLKILGL